MTQPPPNPPATSPAPVLLGSAAIVLAYMQSSAAIRAQLTAMIEGLWRSLGSWRSNDIPMFTVQAVPLVQAAMAQMASLTSGYHAAVAQQRTGRYTVPTSTFPYGIADVRNGADPKQVYGRPFHTVWSRLAELPHEPGAIETAIGDGMKAAVKTAVTDLQLAKTHASQDVLAQVAEALKLAGYRRILEGAHSCGLCIVASTELYHHRKLMPIHPGCDCGVGEVYADEDPALAVNEHLLGDLHAAIADRFGASNASAGAIPGQDGLTYRDVIVEHKHGELGPILGVRGQHFTSPSDLRGAA